MNFSNEYNTVINNNVSRSKSYPHNLNQSMKKEIQFRTVYINFDELFNDKFDFENSPLVSEDMEYE